MSKPGGWLNYRNGCAHAAEDCTPRPDTLVLGTARVATQLLPTGVWLLDEEVTRVSIGASCEDDGICFRALADVGGALCVVQLREANR